MKLWSHICLLVLAASSRSRGKNFSTTGHGSGEPGQDVPTDGITHATLYSSPRPSSETEAASTQADAVGTNTKNRDDQTPLPWTNVTYADQGNGSGTVTETTLTTGVTKASRRTSSVAVDTTDVSKTTSASKPVSAVTLTTPTDGYSSGGYVLLVLIVILIVGLCAMLYMLRRSSRTYSFDLQRPLPLSYANEPTGTFEPVHLDDLESPAQLDDVAADDLPPPSVGNGTTAQSEESSSNGLKSPVEAQDANGLGTDPISPPVSEQSAENSLDSATLLTSGALEVPQNENNNNPSVCSRDLFVDIDINEPSWSDLPLK